MKFAPVVLVGLVPLGGCVTMPSRATISSGSHRPIPSARALREETRFQKLWSDAVDARRKGDFAQAARHFEEARKMRPHISFVSLKLAEVYDRAGKPKQALAAYQEAFRPRKNRGTLGTAVKPEVYVRYGNLLETSGNRPRARDMYWNALAFPLPENPVGYKPRNASFASVKAAAHIRAGLELALAAEGSEALREMKRAIAADRQDWRAHFQYGAQLYATQRGEAVAALEKAEHLAPQSERPFVRDCRRRMGLYEVETIFRFQPNGSSKTTTILR